MYRLNSKTQYWQLLDGSVRGKRLDLVVAGFDKQSIIPIEIIKLEIGKVPVEHLVGLSQIVYTPRNSVVYPHLTTPKGTHGCYDTHTQVITIAEFSNSNEFAHVLFHEIGHFVFFKWLTQSQRFEWVQLVHLAEKCVSSYARTNAFEDFAETYACYFTNPAAFSKLNRKRRFFVCNVFKLV